MSESFASLNLHFGIPSLDEMLDLPHNQDSSKTGEPGGSESFAIVGPDGSGKSVLALHIASRYYAACRAHCHVTSKVAKPVIAAHGDQIGTVPEAAVSAPSAGAAGSPIAPEAAEPRILYVSSDLKISSAGKVWDNFRLDQPTRRRVPFERNVEMVRRYGSEDYVLKLKELWPSAESGENSLIDFLLPDKDDGAAIGFLDLASHTSGDDWIFVNALLSKLESIETIKVGTVPLPHLLIIDSVLGFETFVGRLDAYGMEQTRRARIAQCMRNAGRHCHLVFVVEEPNENEHLPEEYVTDVVLRLRHRPGSGTVSRTVEIDKARARNHALGEHPFEIRAKDGSSTGIWENADTPVVGNAYVQVFHTISHLSLRVAADRLPVDQREKGEVAGFGLRHLDELLDGWPSKAAGLAVGTCSALIGDASTGKSALAEKFLAEGFKELVRFFIRVYANLKGVLEGGKPDDTAWQFLLNELGASSMSGCQSPAGGGWSLDSLLKEADEARVRGITASQAALEEAYAGKKELFADWLKDKTRQKVRDNLEMGCEPTEGTNIRLDLIFEMGFDHSKELGDASVGDKCLALFNHPNLRRPAVLLTSSDRHPRRVAAVCLDYLSETIEPEIRRFWKGGEAIAWRDGLESALLTFLERQLIVSRFDMADLPAPAVYHMIWRNMLEAKKLLFGPFFPPRHRLHPEKTGRIRLVIDDFRVLCSISPQILADSAFLPFLTFQLERAGITSLLVYTDAVRPDSRPDDQTSRALLSLLKRAILVWTVPFEGRTRVAIAVSPPTRDEFSGIVRRLLLSRREQRWPWEGAAETNSGSAPVPGVTREFELYSGIEEGKPRPVPLAVYLNAETEQFASYVEQEDTFFREFFTPVAAGSATTPGRVVFPLNGTRYLALRDYTHLCSDSIDGHTLVFQVDGSWAQGDKPKGRSALLNQEEYLTEELLEDPEARNLQYPFGLFPRRDKKQRFQYFRNAKYAIRVGRCDRVPFTWDFGFLLARSSPWEVFASRGLQPMMESPLPEKATRKWVHGDLRLIRTIIPFRKADSGNVDENNTVGGVYKRLSSLAAKGDGEDRPYPSWRRFFGACRTVADMHSEQTGASAVAFDLSASSPESVNILILEIWFSEIKLEQKLRGGAGPDLTKMHIPEWNGDLGSCTQTGPLADILRSGIEQGSIKAAFECFLKSWDDKCESAFKHHKGDHNEDWIPAVPGRPIPEDRLDQLKRGERYLWQSQDDSDSMTPLYAHLPLGAFCLYKTWLLLLEVLDFESFLDPDKPFSLKENRSASLQSVASRHWYKTACSFAAEMHRTEGIHDSPTALRLPGAFTARGDWFLGSPRSSRSRLLACRAFDLLCSRRSNLSRMQLGLGLPVRDVLEGSPDEQGELRTALRCRAHDGVDHPSRQLKYGELASLGAPEGSEGSELNWLWRSMIPGYDRQSRVLQKWTARLFHWTVELRQHLSRNWRSGFEAYDALTCRKISGMRTYPSFLEFAERCDLLVAELKAASDEQDSVCEAPLTP